MTISLAAILSNLCDGVRGGWKQGRAARGKCRGASFARAPIAARRYIFRNFSSLAFSAGR